MSNSDSFNKIYKYNLWGFGSGIGSISFLNKPYIDFINNYLNSHPDIKTIVDIGCGDWQIARNFNLKDKEYLGCDVSDFIIQKLKKDMKRKIYLLKYLMLYTMNYQKEI